MVYINGGLCPAVDCDDDVKLLLLFLTYVFLTMEENIMTPICRGSCEEAEEPVMKQRVEPWSETCP